MRILFISDIHGISNNLKYIKKIDEDNDFDKIVVLGDLYYNDKYETDNNAVRDFLDEKSKKIICLSGNCDTAKDILQSNFPIIDFGLINVDGIDIYLNHGDMYSYNKSSKLNKKGVLIYGHEHTPYIKKKDDMTFVCVGSISLPRDDFGASYGIYENKKITIYNLEGLVIAESYIGD